MCWTDNRENKILYFKDVGLWYLPDEKVDRFCTSGKEMKKIAASESIRKRCCIKKNYWEKEDIK